MFTYKINTLDDLEKFAARLSKALVVGDVVALSGPLGSGKTTLTQFVALNLGIKKDVLSPTFTIFKHYPLSGTRKQFCHIDLYRLTDFSRPHGFEEYLGDKDSICFVEWAEKAKHIFPTKTIWIKFVLGKNRERTIKTTHQI